MATICEAWEPSEDRLKQIAAAVGSEVAAESSLVTFRSLGRMDFTPSSDLDWCLIVDGRADVEHRQVQLRSQDVFRDVEGVKDPNPTGAFGALVFSHEVIHCIGGTQDTNANLTRRLLLLIDSVELNDPAIDRPANLEKISSAGRAKKSKLISTFDSIRARRQTLLLLNEC